MENQIEEINQHKATLEEEGFKFEQSEGNWYFMKPGSYHPSEAYDSLALVVRVAMPYSKWYDWMPKFSSDKELDLTGPQEEECPKCGVISYSDCPDCY